MSCCKPCHIFLIFFVSLTLTTSPNAQQNLEDPLFYRQWQFKGNSAFSDSGSYQLGVINSENQLGMGEENVLMIISFGVKTDHEDLDGAFWINPDEIPNDGIDNDNNGYVDDIHGINTQQNNGDLTDNDGFGTNIAGIVSATPKNGLGIRGISPTTKLVVCKVHDDFNSRPIGEPLSIIDECLNYAIALKNNSVNLFAVSLSNLLDPGFYTLEREAVVKSYQQLLNKVEQNNLLWISGLNGEATLNLDYLPLFPVSLYSPNFVSASRLNRRLVTYSNYGRGVTTSVVVEDIMTTTNSEKYVSNGNYILDITPADDGVVLSDSVNIVPHPDNQQTNVWHVDALANNGSGAEIILPPIDLSELNTTALLIDVSLKRKKRISFYNKNGNPIYTDISGSVKLSFKVDDSDTWQIFTKGFTKSRAIWDLFTADLKFNRYFFPAITPDSRIQFRLQINGDETYIDNIKVWAEEDGHYEQGYDYASPTNAGAAILAGLAGKIKAYNDDWPAWKIANALTSGGALNEFFPTYNYPINISGNSVVSLSVNEEGVLECTDNVVQRRLLPSLNHTVYLVVGETYDIITKSIKCEMPGEAFTYTDSFSGDKFVARDDGGKFDAFASDGQGILSYKSSVVGAKRLVTAYDYDFNAIVFNRYQAIKEIDNNWIQVDRDVAEGFSFWTINPIKLQVGGVSTDISKSFSQSGIDYNGITTLKVVTDIIEPLSSVKAKKSDINLDSKSAATTANFRTEFTNAVFDPDVLVEKGLDSVRIYLAPFDLNAYQSSNLWVKGEAPNRQVIQNYGEMMQIIFEENGSSIQFNYGDLHPLLEGVDYEIGIEIGRVYRQRKQITLTSNTSFKMDVDSDGDGVLDFNDSDNDNDGVDNLQDEFPYNPSESSDLDQDGVGDNADSDDDNDGIEDAQDAFPFDTDNDGIDNRDDEDDDNDNVTDSNDVFPLDPTESADFDNNGVGDNADLDDDKDGIEDDQDAFPFDSSEHQDSDEDGIGNNSDTDDDNDGTSDSADPFPQDTDNNGVDNRDDSDDDGDGVPDQADAFQYDPNEDTDTDIDGIGNNRDEDDDGDGVNDSLDAFPLDSTEDTDTDTDGVGNRQDTDDDGDGVSDEQDAFPLDSSESIDTDNDGLGNQQDTDDDGDGVLDVNDQFPLDASRSASPAPAPPSPPTESSGGGGSTNPLILSLFIILIMVRKKYLRIPPLLFDNHD